MFERFTQRAREAVEKAMVFAQTSGAEEVRPEHLLAALLADPGSLAARVLDGLGAPVERIGSELDARRTQYVDGLDQDDAEALRAIGIDLDAVVRRIETHLGGLPTPRRRRPRMSRGAKRVLELSLREAVALRHTYIGTEHLLLALARTDDRVVSDTLAAVGVDRPALRVAVAEAVRQAG